MPSLHRHSTLKPALLVLALAGAWTSPRAAPAAPASTPAFGATPAAGGKPHALPLPPAPDLAALPRRFDRLPLKLHVAGNTALHAQVADDAAFDHIQVDVQVDAGDDIRIPQLADGTWHLRVRRVDAAGLEGPEAVHDFQLRARPESPFLMEPPANAKRPVGDVALRWTHSADAARYAIEVARDPRFEQVALRDENVHGEQLVFHPVATDFGAADGVYWWHVASIAVDGRRGAWGDAQALILRPTPRAPIGHLSPDGAAIELAWGGRPEDRVEVELARDAGYQQILARGEFSAPGARLPRPPAGPCYAHYRFVEPDGFKTAWSGDVRIEVDSDWRLFWRRFVPDALLK